MIYIYIYILFSINLHIGSPGVEKVHYIVMQASKYWYNLAKGKTLLFPWKIWLPTHNTF